MGVHCYLTELGILVTMAAKIVSVVATLATLAAGEPGYGGVAYHPYGGSSTHTGVLRVFMDTMVGMDTLARGQLRLSPGMDMVMDMELLLSMSPRLTMDMDTPLPITLMDITLDMDMARGLLTPSPDTVMVML